LSVFRRFIERFHSIKFSVTLCAVATVAGGIALNSYVQVSEAERSTLLAQRENNLRESARTASSLSRRVVSMQLALARVGDQLDPATLKDPAALRAFYLSKPVLLGMFSNLFAADLDGRMLLLANGNGVSHPTMNLADRAYFRATLTEGRAIVSEPATGRFSAEPVVVFTQPLKSSTGVFGVIGGGLRLQSRDLLDELTDGLDDGVDPLVIVTDSRGRILAHPQRSRIMQSVANEPNMSEGYAAWLALGGASGGAIEPSGIRLPQTGQVLAVAGVPGPDWLIWRALPEAQLLAPLQASRQKALWWAFGTAVGASLLVLAILRMLLRPLVQLQKRALNLFDVANDVHAGWPQARGEIGELTRVLHHVGAERQQLEQFNSQVLAKLGSVMAAAPVGILFTRERRFELVSAEACRLLCRSEQDLLGAEARSIFSSADEYERLGVQVALAFGQGLAYAGELQFNRVGGEPFHGQLMGRPVDVGNASAGTIWTLADVSEQVHARAHLEWSAHHDVLTGLGNRKLFMANIQRLIAAGPDALPAAIVMIDLDHFKPINDAAGHAAGDAMLKAVAQAIAEQVRANDQVARLGGDEFVVLLERCPQDAACRVANNIRLGISRATIHVNGKTFSVGASIGVAELQAETASAEEWLHRADVACYEAKAAGRGVVRASFGSLRVVGTGTGT
jgi:diguanylate cyclase (GGDEF)-like protein